MALNAVAPERAVSFTPARRLEERQFQQLTALGVIKPASAGYYIDIPAYNAWSIDRHRGEARALTITLLVIVLIMAAVAIGIIPRH